jgi:surface carbohydrate biosynthesis protein
MLVYLPVETSRRELVAKTFLAAELASKGYPVAVFKSTFFETNGWPSPGIYVGKNCFRNAGFGEEEHYNALRRSGIRLWHLDEEGGVYIGTSEEAWKKILLKRLNAAALQEDDKILTWGEWQREAFAALEPRCPVCVTGSPNFDAFGAGYAEALAEFDRVETEGREDFILVNTRFSLSNGLLPIKRHLQPDSPVSQHVDPRSLRHWIAQSGILQYSFISLVQQLAEALPNDEIVLRPHPAEDPELYHDLLEGFPNVSVEWRGDVGSWIRRCRALIHNGCTTAVQAQVARKPVITYLPVSEADDLSPGLPNLIGRRCETVSAVIAALARNSVADDPESLSRTIATSGAIDAIVSMVQRECPAPAGAGALGEIVAQVEQAARRGRRRDARRQLLRRIVPKQHVNRHKGKKFDAGFFGRAVDLCSAAKECLDGEVDILATHDDCFLVVPRSRG